MSPFLFKRWKILTKSDYLSNSAKLLLISSAMLFAVNTLSFVGMFNDSVATSVGKLSDFCFYAVFVLAFLAFNGEGIAYKHSREVHKKSKTTSLKALVVFAFAARFVKSFVENFVLSFDNDTVSGVVARILLGVFSTASSYGFLLTAVALWYAARDKNEKKLLILEVATLSIGLIYNLFKIFNYTILKYDAVIFGELGVSLFSDKIILNVLCLFQFAFDMLMFFSVLKYYDKKVISEQAEKNLARKKMLTARNIYSADGYGIDTLEDDFFTEKQKS